MYVWIAVILAFNAIVQVMSQSVSQALYLTGGKEAFETAYFIGKIDNFFDCLNVINYTKGIHKRKPFQKPYFKADDSRLEVCLYSSNSTTNMICIYKQYLKGVLAYLEYWEKSVVKRKGFSDQEKKMMLIPQETRDGMHITGYH